MVENASRCRPSLSVGQQIAQLKSKGITFDLMSESDAADYLRSHNTFFRVRSYRANFPKRVGGSHDGEYVGLDFGMLVELAVIDMHLRNVFIGLTLDTEHYAKIKLLNALEQAGEDGYEVVQNFMNQKRFRHDDGSNEIVAEIKRSSNSPYLSGLINYHPRNDYAVWEFIELIPFGRFIHFYKFCAERLAVRSMVDEFYLLQAAKGLRNACAHNSCILNNMRSDAAGNKPSKMLVRALSAIGIGKDARNTKLSNGRMRDIAATLYLHQKVTVETVRKHRAVELDVLSKRMFRHAEYYKPDGVVSTGFAFIGAMIAGWYGDDLTR